MSAATNPIDAGSAFREAMYKAAVDLFPEESIYVSHTNLGQDAEDVVLIGALDGTRDQESRLMSASQRSQDWDYALDVHSYAFRAGGADEAQECDAEAFTAASEYMARIAEHVRRGAPDGDTTLGGTVMWCFLESMNTTPGEVSVAGGIGRMWEFVGTFVARVRVSG